MRDMLLRALDKLKDELRGIEAESYRAKYAPKPMAESEPKDKDNDVANGLKYLSPPLQDAKSPINRHRAESMLEGDGDLAKPDAGTKVKVEAEGVDPGVLESILESLTKGKDDDVLGR